VSSGMRFGPAMEKVSLSAKFRLFEEYWSPKIVGELNDSYVKLVKLKGDFEWHKHKSEDELFLVTKGKLTIMLRNRNIVLERGEFFIVPKGVEHKPVAKREAHAVLIEPKTTLNTGNLRDKRTVEKLERI
jgi:mannose-6-phosphate isomerase-like protein (cupin superfamily)